MKEQDAPLVNICLYTYDHQNYIAETIESVLMQQTSFRYVIVIGEDFSTDNTREICIKYKEKYPEKINLILQPQNLGAINNSFIVHNSCNAKYVAILEGDDYWTDPFKLQKQVDYMEKNPGTALCYHKVEFMSEDKTISKVFPLSVNKNNSDIEDVIAYPTTGWNIMTSSVMYRKQAVGTLPKWLLKLKVGDWPITLLAALNGTVDFIQEVMSVYRYNPTSLMNTKDYTNAKVTGYLVQLYEEFNRHTKYKYRNQIYKQLLFLIYQLIEYYKKEKMSTGLLWQTIKYNHYKALLSYQSNNVKTKLSFILNYPYTILRKAD